MHSIGGKTFKMKSKIVTRKVEVLKCYENNPRNNENAVEKVAESIKQFGFLVPIVIDTNNTIVAGETRLKASKLLDLQEIPCIVADELSEEQLKAFRLIENKTSEFASWDFEKLAAELADIEIDMNIFEFPNFEDIELDISDDEFLQDTENTKEKKKNIAVCPHCGKEFEL